MRTSKLLIVDDEWMISDSLRSMEEWKERNIEVVGTAASGREALQWVEQEDLDMILTDIHMPDMSGLELLQRLYETKPGINVILISGYEEFTYACTALRYQAKGYVTKPIDTDELFSIVDSLLDAETKNGEESGDAESPKTYHEAIVERAITYMKTNLDKPLSLKRTAEEVHLTPHYFGQVFKTVTGETFVNYLTGLRMEKACLLLKNPELKQYEICESIGYPDTKYFAKVFTKCFGMSPREYRRDYINKSRQAKDLTQI
ncbi:response regulator [Paenibacillus sp. 7124]|uniref:Response regulator n=1 Tax=Paenibacillus apii TaxID=1850370 RepID=A0A6M1PM10_9BACL|nr:response regulator [Paenibacillus apii]NGM84697.1 response regulator [Paenibacillus apii]NJJ41314.1 response regulator [Paenibacillus apii]